MKSTLTFILMSMLLSFGAFAQDYEYGLEELPYETDSIDHEMFLACVSTKLECKTLAQQQGIPFLKVMTDRARCPQRPKTKACIVKH